MVSVSSAFARSLALVCCCLLVFSLAGCTKSTEPVQTTPDALDQYLEDNPDEAYSSDDLAAEEEMAEDEDDGSGE